MKINANCVQIQIVSNVHHLMYVQNARKDFILTITTNVHHVETTALNVHQNDALFVSTNFTQLMVAIVNHAPKFAQNAQDQQRKIASVVIQDTTSLSQIETASSVMNHVLTALDLMMMNALAVHQDTSTSKMNDAVDAN